MDIKNEWLESEIKAIHDDKKRKRVMPETTMAFRILLLVGAVFFCSTSLEARAYRHTPNKMAVVEGGHVQFTCHKCRMVQWQDKKNANWRGEFFCTSCGTKMQ